MTKLKNCIGRDKYGSIRRGVLTMSVLGVIAIASTARATAFTWDPGTTPATPTGGTGNWDLSNVFWSDLANDFIWTNTTADTATFAGTAGTVTIGAPIQANQLIFNTANYVVANGAGGSLNLAGTTPTINAAANATINAALTGTAGLTKTGAAKLTLGGANTYTGNTTLSAGMLALAAGASLNANASLVANGTSTLDLGGNTLTVANLSFGTNATAFTTTATNGSLTVASTGNITLGSVNNAASSVTKLDMTGLTNFTANLAVGKTFLVTSQAAGGVTPAATSVVSLGANNTISATVVQVGNGVGATVATGPYHIGQLELGQTNAINTDSFLIGAFRGNGAVNFRIGLTGATLALRGYAGGSTPLNLLQVAVNQNGQLTNSSMDLSGGSVDAIINTAIVAQSNSGGANANGVLSIGGGNLTVGTLTLSNSISVNTTTVANVFSTFNHSAGTVLANAVNFSLRNPASGGITDNLTATYNLGTNAATPTSGTLSAVSIGFGAGTLANNARETLNFNNGVITNYEPSLGQAGAAAAVGAPATPQNLVISGVTGGGAGNNNSTLTINLPAAGTHSLRATSGQSITVNATALITGAGGLTIDGAGQVNLLGNNTYTGTTTAQAGTLRATPSTTTLMLTSAGGVDVQGGKVLLDYTGGSSPVGQVKLLLDAGYATNGGNFSTGQIRSTTAAAAGNTIGYADNGTDTVTVRVTLPGDANLDGMVDFNDFLALQSNFGNINTTFGQANFNYDGQTDFNDFLALQSHFGQSINGATVNVSAADIAAMSAFASSVPEPTLLSVMGIGAVAALRRRRSH